MFRTKKDVDRHVQEILRKLKSEKERSLRCYNIAKLYFQVGDYENARRYVSSYLTVRDDSAIAHKLLGQILEALGQKEKAVLEYKCSLELESTQSDLVLKVCELLSETEVTMDLGRARYWCDRAEQLYPHHPAVFKLKEHLLSAKGEENLQDLESLITNELIARPTDLSLRIRLLRLYQDTGRIRDAYNHAIDVEIRSPFREELQWYECLNEVFKAYREKSKDSCAWDFYLYYTSSLEKVAYLSLCDNRVPSRHSLVECVQHLFSFDQILNVAAKQSPPASERELYQEFLRHMRGQLCLHLGTLILKRAKKDKSSWRESCRLVSPLLLLAISPLPDLQASWLTLAADSRKKLVEWWVKEAAYRNSQAGHVLLSMVHERKSQFLDRVMQFCSGNWRERLFQRIFNTRDHQQAISSSYFVSYSGFSEPPLQLPSSADLRVHDEMSQQLNPKSLHHMVWLGLHEMALSKKNAGSKQNKDFCCHVFEGLQMTTKNMNSAGVETLNRLDIDAFLYSTVLCVASMQEELQSTAYWSNEAPSTLPANLTDQLCTVQQDKWWVAAYSIFKNQAQGNLGELRQIVQRGIEVVRVLGNHGLDVRLIVQLARIFSERASSMSAQAESAPDLAAVEARAALYWTSALPLLEKLQRNQAIRAPHTRLFEYQGKELAAAEITALIEEGRFFLASQLMKEEKHERAIEAFEQLKSPYASFYSALIYKRLAGEQLQDLRGEMITSEMRSQHIILLTKARECFYLTLDRLKIPGVDTKHPLNGELSAHIEEIENQLHHIDPDVSRNNVNRNDVEALSGDSESSDHSQGGNINSLSGFANNGIIHDSLLLATSSRQNVHRHSSTPYRSSHRLEFPDTLGPGRLEPRPSPERLDAQIRQLIHSRDMLLETVTQQSKSVLDNMKIIMDNIRDCKQEIKETRLELKDYNQELKISKQAFNEVKEQVQELRKEILKLKKGQSHLNSELSQVCDPEDDLYVFDEEDYSEDMNMTSANHVGAYTTFQPFPNYPNYRPMSGIMGTSTVSYPASAEAQASLMQPSGFLRGMEPAALLYPSAAMSYYGAQGALPFSEGQQLPDFRNQPVPTFTRPVEEPKLPQSLVAPVNVVITSSDSLPTTTPISQPTLSVTIPPQHRLGGGPVMHTSTTPSLPQTGVPATISAKPVISVPQTPDSQVVPHAFQISMPPQAQLPRASVLMKEAADLSPVLPISTNSLLSSVPSPVYSAVVPEKSPSSKETSPVKRVSTGSVGEEEAEETDHDPCPDFQPIIPLPAEVEIMTGEEEETVLFESRAKLFRFVEKEWKERGVGNIKILLNRSTNKVRILMRREQVLKVCANHLILPEMELVRMSAKAWIWVANDFADEAVVLEKLCVCFKTADEAENFKDSFENAKSIMKKQQSPTKQTVSKPEVLPVNTTPIPQKAQITTNSTPVTTQTLTTTDTPKSHNVTSSDSQSKIKFGGFTFATAPTLKLNQNKAKESEEKVTDQKEDISKPSPFASFSFSTKATAESLNIKEQSKPQTIVQESRMQNVLFNSEKRDIGGSGDNPFASPQPNAFKVDANFKGFEGAGSTVFGQQSVKESIATKPEDESAGDGASEEFVPTTEFTPVIPLPELIEVKTGEEGEVVIFQERAKLLRFTSETKEWKERGIGSMKILNDPKTGKVRLLMRREQVLKVCCNHMLTTSMKFEFSSTSDRALHWAAQDYSEGEVRPELLAIRFKTVESAKHFKQLITDLQSKMINDRLPADQNKSSSSSHHSHDKETSSVLEKTVDSGSQKKDVILCFKCNKPMDKGTNCKSCTVEKKSKPLSEVCKPKPGSWECDSCYTQNEGNCNSCASCETLKPGVEKSTSNVPLSEAFKKKPGSWECSECYTTNVSGTSCVACSSSRPGFENETDKKPEDKTAFKFGISNQSVSSGFSSSLFTNNTPNASFSFGVPAINTESKADLGTVTSGDSEKTDTIERKENTEPTFLFGPGANKEASKITFTFGSKDSKNEVDNSSQSVDRRFTFGSPSKFEFNFSGVKAITPVKSPKSPGTKGASSGGEDDSGSEVEDEGDNIYFTPVIALPEKVPLHTGEEDETVVYSQHAKLFRFVNGEWKDRGIGDIKILEHKDNKKVRLLMRRDQVLKICLNHFLTPGLSFMKKDAKTWLWSAPDFSEGQINNEKFALRFKNPEIAATFKNAIDEALEKLSCNAAPKSSSSGQQEKSTDKLSSTLKEFSFALPVSNSAQSEPKFSLANRLGTTPEVKKGVRSLFGGSSESEKKPLDDAVEVLYELSVTDEEKAEAERLLLPPNFFAYRKKPGCSGCPGCKDDHDSEVEETGALRNTSKEPPQLSPNLKSSIKTASDTKSPDISQQTKSFTLNSSQDSTISSNTKNGQTVIKPAKLSFTSSIKSESEKQPELKFSWPTASSSQNKQSNAPASTFTTPPVFGSQGVSPALPLFGAQGAASAPSLFGTLGVTPAQPLFGQIGAAPVFGAQGVALASPVFGTQGAAPAPTLFGAQGAAPAPPVLGSQVAAPAPPVLGSQVAAPAPPVLGSQVAAPAPPVLGSQVAAPAPPVLGSQVAAPAPPVLGSQVAAPAPPVLGSQVAAPAPPVLGSQVAAPAPPVFGAHVAAPAPPVFGAHVAAPAPPVFGAHVAAPAPPVLGAQVAAPAPPVFGAQVAAPAPPVFGAQVAAPAPSVFGAHVAAPAPPVLGAQGAAPTPPFFGQSSTALFSDVKRPTDPVSNKPPWEKDSSQDKVSNIFSAPKLSVQTTQSQSPLQSFSLNAGLSTDKVGKTPGFDFKIPVQTGLELLKASTKQTDKESEWKPPVSSKGNNEVLFTNTTDSTATLFCSNTPELSFASLSANAKSLEFGSAKTNTQPFKGQGSTVFKSTPTKSPAQKVHGKTESDDSSGEEGDDVSHDPHYEPAIALPDTVEVRTGEEDEEIVFMAFATLYRYSSETMEWKERGSGIMKILHDPVKNTYRLLLRREKVHKVVCNNLITPQFELLPFTKTSRSWIWTSHNFVDEECLLENLAVRFRKDDAAQDFYNKVQECIEKLKTSTKEPQASMNSEVSTQEYSEDSEGYEDEDEDDEDEDDDDDEEEEEDDDDDDYVEDKEDIVDQEKDHESIGDSILYPLLQSRAQFFEFSDKWKNLGIGIVCIKYHSGSNGAVLSVHSEDSNKVICRMMIDQTVRLTRDGVNCEWIGMNEASNTSTKFKAQFFSDIEAQEFERAFSEGMDLHSTKEFLAKAAL